MRNARFVRTFAVPVATVGIILNALLHATPAFADPSDDDDDYSDTIDSPFYGPNTYAGPGYDYADSGGPGGDFTVQCSPCA